MKRLSAIAAATFAAALLSSPSLAWDTASCGSRNNYNPETSTDCFCAYQYALEACGDAGGATNPCLNVALGATVLSCEGVHGTVNFSGTALLIKQTDGAETHTYSFTRSGSGTGYITLINAEGIASDTRNVSSASVTLNSASVISSSSFLASTEQLTEEVSLASGTNTITITTNGARGDYVSVVVEED